MSVFVLVCLLCAAAAQNWPSFRGPGARGIGQGQTPFNWNVETGENVLWKVPISGLAHSSPVVWGDRIFLTSAVGGDPNLKVGLYGAIQPVEDNSVHSYRVYCLDRKTGKILWERTAHEGIPRIKRHPKSTHANSTPATDGKHLVVFFGSEGLYCYDLEGNLLWKKDLGVLDSGYFMVPDAQWGFGSSPIIYEGKVIIQSDVLKGSFLAAFDVSDGRELWRTARSDVPTWSTPTVHREGSRTQIIVNGFRHIGGYDAETGEELWKLTGGGDIPIPTPFVAGGLVFITNAHGSMAPIYAIRAGAEGDISLTGGQTSSRYVAWSQLGRTGAYMPTPVVIGDYLYVGRDNGVLSCYRARTGERVYRQRLGEGGAFSASVVSADNKIYFTGEDGDIYVVEAGPEFKQLAVNAMGEVCMATPAISDGVIYFRTQNHLVAVGN